MPAVHLDPAQLLLVEMGQHRTKPGEPVGYSQTRLFSKGPGTLVFFYENTLGDLPVGTFWVVRCVREYRTALSAVPVEQVAYTGPRAAGGHNHRPAQQFLDQWMANKGLVKPPEPPILVVRDPKEKPYTLADCRVVVEPPRAPSLPASAAPVFPKFTDAGTTDYQHEDRGALFKLRRGYFHFWPVGFNSFSPNPAVRFTCVVWKGDEDKPRKPVEKGGKHAYQLLYEAQRDAADMGLKIMWPEDWKLVGHRAYE
jgi:hypothetical protein